MAALKQRVCGIATRQAANILGMSRPRLIKLVRSNQAPHRKSGTHRRLCSNGILKFAQQRNAAGHAALNQMTNDAPCGTILT